MNVVRHENRQSTLKPQFTIMKVWYYFPPFYWVNMIWNVAHFARKLFWAYPKLVGTPCRYWFCSHLCICPFCNCRRNWPSWKNTHWGFVGKGFTNYEWEENRYTLQESNWVPIFKYVFHAWDSISFENPSNDRRVVYDRTATELFTI